MQRRNLFRSGTVALALLTGATVAGTAAGPTWAAPRAPAVSGPARATGLEADIAGPVGQIGRPMRDYDLYAARP